MKKKVNSLTLLISLFLLQSCSKRYLSSIYKPLTAPLNYADLDNWAVHPQNTPSQLDFVKSDGNLYGIDVFYIHPTMTTSPKDSSWHGDVLDENYIIDLAKKNKLFYTADVMTNEFSKNYLKN